NRYSDVRHQWKKNKGQKSELRRPPYSHDDNEEENFVVLKESRSVERRERRTSRKAGQRDRETERESGERRGNGEVRKTFLSFPPSSLLEEIALDSVELERETDREGKGKRKVVVDTCSKSVGEGEKK